MNGNLLAGYLNPIMKIRPHLVNIYGVLFEKRHIQTPKNGNLSKRKKFLKEETDLCQSQGWDDSFDISKFISLKMEFFNVKEDSATSSLKRSTDS